MALASQCLCGNARLQAVAFNNPAMFVGEAGFAVALVQKSLVDLGYKLPVSMGAGGLPDGNFRDFVSIVVSNTYKSAKFPDRRIDALSRAFARDPLLLDMDHHLGNAHRPLRSPKTFHETPEIRALLLKMWEQKGLETFCKAVADAPFNPLRDVKK